MNFLTHNVIYKMLQPLQKREKYLHIFGVGDLDTNKSAINFGISRPKTPVNFAVNCRDCDKPTPIECIYYDRYGTCHWHDKEEDLQQTHGIYQSSQTYQICRSCGSETPIENMSDNGKCCFCDIENFKKKMEAKKIKEKKKDLPMINCVSCRMSCAKPFTIAGLCRDCCNTGNIIWAKLRF